VEVDVIKAIETKYKGYRFRSRLEARWAVFFDAMGFDWAYEPEGFVLSDCTHYLPDFKVITPQGEVIWYEVKPNKTSRDIKFSRFYDDSVKELGDDDQPFNHRIILLSGDPMEFIYEKTFICPRCGVIDDPAYGTDLNSNSSSFPEAYFGCEPCDHETPCGGDHETEDGVCGLLVRPHKGFVMVNSNDYKTLYHGRMYEACVAARSARFEHGETPR
jgi:hypothetical protein